MTEPRLESLDLNLLLALHWLLEERGVTRAAARLGVSQPAASRSLGRLRAVFDDPLLVPQGRAMVPSPRATALRPALADAIARLRQLVAEPSEFRPAAASGSFRIACTDYLGLVLAKSWAAGVAPLAPDLDLDLPSLRADSASQLVTGELDLVAMPDLVARSVADRADLSGIERRVLFDERFVCVASPRHPWAGRRPGLARFAALQHVLVSPTQRGIGVVDEILAQHGQRRRIAYRVSTFVLALDIVAAGGCVAVLPSRLAAAAGRRLGRIRMPIEVPGFSVLTGWHASRTPVARHAWVRDILMASVADGSSTRRSG